jgi:hypothetical protein
MVSAALQARQWTVRKGVSFMQSTARENVNIPAYGNVEHQGTAIVSEISIKWGRRPIFRESLRPRAAIDRLGPKML